MSDLLNLLAGGTRKTLDNVDLVIEKVGSNQELFDELFSGLTHKDDVIRIRATDAVEKLSRKNLDFLKGKNHKIYKLLNKDSHFEIKMSLAAILGYLNYTNKNLPTALNFLFDTLKTETNKFVIVNCISSLVSITLKFNEFKTEVLSIIEEQMIKGSPAIKARCRKELKRLDKEI